MESVSGNSKLFSCDSFFVKFVVNRFIMVVSEIQLYELLKGKLGDKEASALVEIIETRIDKKFEENKNILATKEDLANTKSDILRWTFVFVFGALLLNIIAIIGAVMAVANIVMK